MKPTLMRVTLVAIAAPVLAAAQKPVPRVAPWPKVEVFVEPKIDALVFPKFELEQQMDMLKSDAFDLRMQAEQLAQLNVDIGRIDVENFKLGALDLKNHAFDLKDQILLDMPRMDLEFGPRGAKLLESRPPAPWAQQDPADSLYRAAREALNRGEYRRAAQLFNEVTKRFPQSQYAQDSAYWEAFSRYRLGSTDDLKQ